jgi:hypothetical protein
MLQIQLLLLGIFLFNSESYIRSIIELSLNESYNRSIDLSVCQSKNRLKYFFLESFRFPVRLNELQKSSAAKLIR